ncbi:MAG TPA: hypothetical protein VLB74_07660 [Flavobacterium sp.]|uniref:hypothetical protein n=1 Tax=Flavobacterium sp. TaxID=239 RepID=UPI002CD5A9C1|nr:hypothetical protein [Flavobacterium sp.]HSD14508.1 hypothetical protein [Flavobacterium sp.]
MLKLVFKMKEMFDDSIGEYLIQNCHICPIHDVIKLNGSPEGNHIHQIRDRIEAVFGVAKVDYELICLVADKLMK